MLRVHFLNVGHGDCTIIEHPSGRLTMVDVNNSQSYDVETRNELLAEEVGKLTPASAFLWSSPFSTVADADRRIVASGVVEAKAKRELTDPVQYMRDRFAGRSLYRFVLTHPDLDHMRGLRRIHDTIGFANFWDTANIKPEPSFRSGADREDWEFYRRMQADGRHRLYGRGASAFAFGKDANGYPGGDGIEILSPDPEIVGACNTRGLSNDISIVLRIHHAGRTVLLPGDVESLAWDNMVDTYGGRLKSDFLKASHHGRDTGYHLEALQHIRPAMTFVSVGRKPATDASGKYRGQSRQVASTRYYGNIVLTIHDDGKWGWSVQHNAGA